MRDEHTANHSARVTEYSCLLGQHLDIPQEELLWIKIGTPLHDIGKISIPDKILYKPSKFTPEEFDEMKTHTTKGAKVIEQIADLAPILPIVRSHHERWDGKGYLDGLKGENIPRLARIVAVANAFDSMTADQSYRAGVPPEVAFAEIEIMRGLQFDPLIAAAFLVIRQKILQKMQS
jgi:HD-GYP domain-containing protein (c-di-GMP phosphodiesterase class II)